MNARCVDVFNKMQKVPVAKNMEAHSASQPVSCTECGKKCKSTVGLQVHYKREHLINHQDLENWNDIWKCDWCDRSFTRRFALKSHLHQYHRDRFSHKRRKQNMTCPRCGTIFFKTGWVDRHMNSVTCVRRRKAKVNSDRKKFECPICRKKYVSKGNLLLHLGKNVHKNVKKKYVCHICNEKYILKSSLIDHVRQHKKSKVYECIDCNAQFDRKMDLLRHALTHPQKSESQGKTEVSQDCGSSEEESSDGEDEGTERLGEKEWYNVEGIFECGECGVQYNCRNTLLTHMRRIHE